MDTGKRSMVDACWLRRKQHPRRQQHALGSGFAGQHFGVLLGVHPNEHARQRLLAHLQAQVLNQLQAALAGGVRALAQALHVLAVLALGPGCGGPRARPARGWSGR